MLIKPNFLGMEAFKVYLSVRCEHERNKMLLRNIFPAITLNSSKSTLAHFPHRSLHFPQLSGKDLIAQLLAHRNHCTGNEVMKELLNFRIWDWIERPTCGNNGTEQLVLPFNLFWWWKCVHFGRYNSEFFFALVAACCWVRSSTFGWCGQAGLNWLITLIILIRFTSPFLSVLLNLLRTVCASQKMVIECHKLPSRGSCCYLCCNYINMCFTCKHM